MQEGNKSLSLSFFVPGRFHPGYSWLGRYLRRRVRDELYAEGLYILLISLIGVGLMLLFFLGWAGLQLVLAARPDEAERLVRLYFAGQVGASLLFFVTCFMGFKPALNLRISGRRTRIRQGARECVLPLHRIRRISPASALQFHRHYRKYEGTRSFFVRLPNPLLCLDTDTGPVFLGLPQEDHPALMAHWERQHVPVREPATMQPG